jgi:hypothetical protein
MNLRNAEEEDGVITGSFNADDLFALLAEVGIGRIKCLMYIDDSEWNILARGTTVALANNKCYQFGVVLDKDEARKQGNTKVWKIDLLIREDDAPKTSNPQ